MVSVVDTSVLIAGMVASHPHHGPSLTLLQKVRNKKLQAAICQHTLAECYSVLTAYPMTPVISPATAEKLIQENILPNFQIIELARKDYLQAIQRAKTLGLRSGSIFDLLIWQAAFRRKAKAIYTWNIEDFKRISVDEIEILTP